MPLPLSDRTAPAASYSFACILNTLEWGNENSKYESPLPKSPLILKIGTISGRESLSSQKQRALRKDFLQTILLKRTCLLRNSVQKCSLDEKHPFLTKIVLIFNHVFIECNASLGKIRQYSSSDILVKPEAFDILSILDELHKFWGISYFGDAARQNSNCLYQSWIFSGFPPFNFQTYFVHSRRDFYSLGSFFSIMVISLLQVQKLCVFWETFWSLKYNMMESQVWF